MWREIAKIPVGTLEMSKVPVKREEGWICLSATGLNLIGRIGEKNPIEVTERLGFPSAALPRWRTGRGVAGHKLVGHPEQVPQHIGTDARQANQHDVMADVVVRHVVNIGVCCEQLRAIIEIHPNTKRARFDLGALSGDSCHEFSMDLECRGPVRCALLDAGQGKSICRTVSKSIVFPGIVSEIAEDSNSAAQHTPYISVSLP